MKTLKISVLLEASSNKDDEFIPKKATKGSSGYDLKAAITDYVIISPGYRFLVPTGISLKIPEYMEAQVRPRSGLAAKHGMTVLNSPGTIDSDYTGEIKVILINSGQNDFVLERGMRIAQLVFAQSLQCEFIQEEYSATESLVVGDQKSELHVRGIKGFGSTGE